MEKEFIIVGWESNDIWKTADVLQSISDDYGFKSAEDIDDAMVFDSFKKANDIKDMMNNKYSDVTWYVLLKSFNKD